MCIMCAQPALYVCVCVCADVSSPSARPVAQHEAQVASVRAAATATSAELSSARAEVSRLDAQLREQQEQLEAQWECSVCFGSMDGNMAALEPCGHMFCTACVGRVTGDAVPCPKCRGGVTGSHPTFF